MCDKKKRKAMNRVIQITTASPAISIPSTPSTPRTPQTPDKNNENEFNQVSKDIFTINLDLYHLNEELAKYKLKQPICISDRLTNRHDYVSCQNNRMAIAKIEEISARILQKQAELNNETNSKEMYRILLLPIHNKISQMLDTCSRYRRAHDMILQLEDMNILTPIRF